MRSVTRPRGPLPARVYWTRRLLVLGVVCALVLGLARLLGGSPESSNTPLARPAAAPADSPTSGVTPSAMATGDTATSGDGSVPSKGERPKREKTPLAMPTGPCQDSDIVVDPSVEEAYAGSDVTISLRLTTKESPACNWEVSPESVVVRLTSGSDRIWSSQDCPGAISRQSVVVRKDQPTSVFVTWHGQRSDDECTRTTPWAQPGFYHVTAAALGAEPLDQQFELQTPTPVTITPTPSPRKQESEKAEERRD